MGRRGERGGLGAADGDEGLHEGESWGKGDRPSTIEESGGDGGNGEAAAAAGGADARPLDVEPWDFFAGIVS